MSWRLITDEWRLKLLALALAVLMLGAVAFSQYRPTTKSLQVGLDYTVQSNIVVINPPSKTTVTYTGLADAVSRVDTSNLFATVDASRALPGAAVRLNVTARSTVPDVKVQNPPSIVANIDSLQTVDIPVQVIARAATGWSIDASKTLVTCPGAANPSPCKVRFTGPVSWENGLKAVAIIQSSGGLIGTSDLLNQPVQLQTPKGNLDLSVVTKPAPIFDVTSANVHIEAVAGTTTASVPLIASAWSHGPPAGYQVTAVTITPNPITITGDAAVLQRIQNIALPAADLSSSTSDVSFQVAISYPDGVTGPVATATIKYTISKNPT